MNVRCEAIVSRFALPLGHFGQGYLFLPQKPADGKARNPLAAVFVLRQIDDSEVFRGEPPGVMRSVNDALYFL